MPIQLSHERLTEAHDFIVGLTFGIEIRPTLGTAYRQAGQGIPEDLLEPQKFDDAGVYAWVEPKAALVRPQCGVELDAVALVDLDTALVVDPSHSEHDLAFRFDDTVDDVVRPITGIAIEQRTQRQQDLLDGLIEFILGR